MSKAARRRVRDGFALVALCTVGFLTRAPAIAAPTLEEVVANFGLGADEVRRVRAGDMVQATAKETSDRELAVAMVFLVKAPVATLVSAFAVGKGFANDPQIQAATEIRGDGTVEDFKAVVLQPGADAEAQRYRRAAPGDTLNLSAAEIATFAALDPSGGTPAVEDAVRHMLLGRYQAYRAKGLAGIAPYARASGKTAQPADDLRRATEAATIVKRQVPAFHDVLMRYPASKPAGLEERFFCIRYAMSGRPNLTLRHRLALPVDEAYVVADREFYVSHEYNDMQAIAGLLPVAEGTAVVYVARTTTDQLGGFGASVKQSIGRGMMSKQIADIFEKTRAGFKAH